jgi:hypothetical protein
MKFILVIIIFVILSNLSFAKEDIDSNGFIKNLTTSIENSIKAAVFNILSAPIQPLINTTKELIKINPNLMLFKDLWRMVIYLINSFAFLMIVYSGFIFITNSFDNIKREKSKEILKNSIIILLITNASLFIYQLISEVGSKLSSWAFNLIDIKLFDINNYNSSISENLIFIFMLILILGFFIIFLGCLYIISSLGLVFFPIAIFLYFNEPTKNYGRTILEILLLIIFIPFINSIILAGASRLLEVPFFFTNKIITLILAMFLVLISFIYFIISISINKKINIKIN